MNCPDCGTNLICKVVQLIRGIRTNYYCTKCDQEFYVDRFAKEFRKVG